MAEMRTYDDPLEPPAEPDRLDEWLRSRLDHPVTLVLLAPGSGAEPTAAEGMLAAAVASLAEIRLFVERCADTRDAGAVERALLAAERRSSDVLLVEQMVEPPANPIQMDGAGDAWPRLALRVADRLGLCDRAFVALIGPGVSPQSARRLGFEDGYALDVPAATLVRALAHEAAARDELRRHGSSPPCYL